MTPLEEFDKKLQAIPDMELIDLCKKELSKLCESGGKSFRMCIPVQVKDTDMLFDELIRRYKEVITAKPKEV